MDLGAIVLKKLLMTGSLDAWARVKHAYLDTHYSGLYTNINSYYNKYNSIPTFEEFEAYYSRDAGTAKALAALKDLEDPDIDIDVAIDALINSYTQTQCLTFLDKFLEKITLLDAQEVKDELADIVMRLDELTHTSETVVAMDTINFFKQEETKASHRFPLGLNNTFDAVLGGAYIEELILIGGKRGAGKSIVCSNLCVNQLELGNSAVYFTIEMTAAETLERQLAIMSGVSHARIRQGNLDFTDTVKLVQARASMFEDAESLVDEFLVHRDKIKFEADLLKNKKLKPNQLVIIDDRELSITAVDLHLQKLKAQLGDTFKLAVIDYMNQVTVPGQENSMYEWTTQIFISKKLKELARKHEICIVSPYQIDDNGGTRFAKGILDAADIALLLDAHSKDDCVLSFETTKIRGGTDLKFSSGMNWDTLKIDPADTAPPAKKLKASVKEKDSGTDDSKADLPW